MKSESPGGTISFSPCSVLPVQADLESSPRNRRLLPQESPVPSLDCPNQALLAVADNTVCLPTSAPYFLLTAQVWIVSWDGLYPAPPTPLPWPWPVRSPQRPAMAARTVCFLEVALLLFSSMSSCLLLDRCSLSQVTEDTQQLRFLRSLLSSV